MEIYLKIPIIVIFFSVLTLTFLLTHYCLKCMHIFRTVKVSKNVKYIQSRNKNKYTVFFKDKKIFTIKYFEHSVNYIYKNLAITCFMKNIKQLTSEFKNIQIPNTGLKINSLFNQKSSISSGEYTFLHLNKYGEFTILLDHHYPDIGVEEPFIVTTEREISKFATSVEKILNTYKTT